VTVDSHKVTAPWATAGLAVGQLRIPVTYVNVILRSLDPGTAAQVLGQSGLGPADLAAREALLTLPQMRRLNASLVQALGEDWHVQRVHRLNLLAHGALGVAVVTAADMQAALAVMERYIGTRAPYVRLARRQDAHCCVVRVLDQVGLGVGDRAFLETVLLAIQAMLEQVHGGVLAGSEVWLALPPPSYRASLQNEVHGALRFDAPEHALVLPRAWLDEASPMRDQAMHEAAVNRAQSELDSLRRASPLALVVANALRAKPGAAPSLGDIAEDLHVTPRTLIRRLKREGTSYRRLLDQVRRELAQEALAEGALPVKEIAYRLGYRDPSNFGRAFRAWTGQSPGAFRARVLDQAE